MINKQQNFVKLVVYWEKTWIIVEKSQKNLQSRNRKLVTGHKSGQNPPLKYQNWLKKKDVAQWQIFQKAAVKVSSRWQKWSKRNSKINLVGINGQPAEQLMRLRWKKWLEKSNKSKLNMAKMFRKQQ